LPYHAIAFGYHGSQMYSGFMGVSGVTDGERVQMRGFRPVKLC
jgi:hypothetical protein